MIPEVCMKSNRKKFGNGVEKKIEAEVKYAIHTFRLLYKWTIINHSSSLGHVDPLAQEDLEVSNRKL